MAYLQTKHNYTIKSIRNLFQNAGMVHLMYGNTLTSLSIVKNILNYYRMAGSITPNLKLSHRDRAIKEYEIFRKKRVDQWNRTEDLDINFQTYLQLHFDKLAK